MSSHDVIVVMILLQVKHLVFDFILQTPYQWMNKGTYGHPGGVLHSGLQAIGTAIAFFYFIPFWTMVLISLVDAIVHYHVDWTKMNLNKKLCLTPQTEEFWWLLGADQFAHQATYVFLVMAVL